MSKFKMLDPQYNAANRTVSVNVRLKPGDSIPTEYQFRLADLPEAIRARVETQGLFAILSQRVSTVEGNAYAKLDGMVVHWERWLSGEWELERKSGFTHTVPVIVEAVAALRGAPVAQVQTWYRKLDKAQKAALEANPAIIAAIAEMEAAAAESEGEDFSDLLGESL